MLTVPATCVPEQIGGQSRVLSLSLSRQVGSPFVCLPVWMPLVMRAGGCAEASWHGLKLPPVRSPGSGAPPGGQQQRQGGARVCHRAAAAWRRGGLPEGGAQCGGAAEGAFPPPSREQMGDGQSNGHRLSTNPYLVRGWGIRAFLGSGSDCCAPGCCHAGASAGLPAGRCRPAEAKRRVSQRGAEEPVEGLPPAPLWREQPAGASSSAASYPDIWFLAR